MVAREMAMVKHMHTVSVDNKRWHGRNKWPVLGGGVDGVRGRRGDGDTVNHVGGSW